MVEIIAFFVQTIYPHCFSEKTGNLVNCKLCKEKQGKYIEQSINVLESSKFPQTHNLIIIMIWVSSLLSFHHCVNTLESTRSVTILATILVSSVLISFILSDPDGKRRKGRLARGNLEKFKGPKALPLVGNMVHLWFPPSNGMH